MPLQNADECMLKSSGCASETVNFLGIALTELPLDLSPSHSLLTSFGPFGLLETVL
jgi:hypothetical protein